MKLALYRVVLGDNPMSEVANMIDVCEKKPAAIHISPEQSKDIFQTNGKPWTKFRGIPVKVTLIGVEE